MNVSSAKDEGGRERPATLSVAADPDETGEWASVRDSWVGFEAPREVVALRAESSIPPPLPPSHVIDLMLSRLAASDWEGTLIAADAILRRHPTHRDAQQCREMAERSLRKLYEERLGLEGNGSAVVLSRSDDLPRADVRTRLVFRMVDGRSSVDDIVAASHLEPLDTLRLLSELVLQDIIGFDDFEP